MSRCFEAGLIPLVAGAGLAVLLGLGAGGCGGTQPNPQPELPAEDCPAASPPLQALMAELSAQGSSFDRKPSAAPTGEGNDVFDLAAISQWGEAGYEVELTWTERCIGDYNLDGMVTVSDLTPLSHYWLLSVDYGDPAEHGGYPWWPSGSPDEDNWRRAAVDGNHDGLIDLGDVTPIGQHWHERLNGYQLYRRTSGQLEFELAPNPSQPAEQPSAPRLRALAEAAAETGLTHPLRYRFIDPATKGQACSYYVCAYETRSGSLGPRSNVVVVNIPGNQPPVAMLSVDPTSGDAGLQVSFDASASHDSDGEIVLFEWDFEGDGVFDVTTDAAPSASFAYMDPGAYQATVCVTDDSGAMAYASVEITIHNQLPTAALVVTPGIGTRLEPVALDASGSSDADGVIVDYAWDFDGDGAYDEHTIEPQLDHLYSEIGELDAAVTVTDNSGGQATATTRVVIENIPPVLEYSITPEDVETGHQITIDLTDSYDLDGEIINYKWSFEDGFVKYLPTPVTTLTYSQGGNYLIGLRVKDDSGDYASGEASVYVKGIQRSVVANAHSISQRPFLNMVNGHPALCYMEENELDEQHYMYVRAADVLGRSWAEPVTVCGARSDSGSWRISLSAVNGHPAICRPGASAPYGHHPSLRYSRALDANGTTWSDPVSVASEIDGWSCGVQVIDGRPTVLYRTPLDYAAIVIAADENGTQWGDPVTLDCRFESFSRLIPIGDQYGFAYTTYSFDELMFVRLSFGSIITLETPVAVLDFDDVVIEPSALAVVDDRPAVCFVSDEKLIYTSAADGLGASWENSWILDHDVYRCYGMELVDRRPAVVYSRSTLYAGGYELVYLRGGSEVGWPWEEEIILRPATSSYDRYDCTPLAVLNGRAAVALRDDASNRPFELVTIYE